VGASWTLRTARSQIPAPGSNRQVTIYGAIEMTTGAWVCRLGRRCAADFIALPDQLLRTFPSAPLIVVICDNDSIHHARKVTACLQEHPALNCCTAPGTAWTSSRLPGRHRQPPRQHFADRLNACL
jgi:DDE superfamily endonuclease